MKNILIVLLTMFSIYVPSYSYISIYPVGFDKNIENESSQEYILYNETSKPIFYRVRVKKMDKENVEDMSEWIKISSKIIAINPSESKRLEITIKSPKGTPPGDYGAYLNIEQIDNSKHNKNSETQVSILMDFTMGIYGYIGENNRDIKVSNINLSEKDRKVRIAGDIKNNNDRLVKLLLIGVTKDLEEYVIDEFRVFKNQSFTFDSESKYIKNKNEINKVIFKDFNTLEVLSEVEIK